MKVIWQSKKLSDLCDIFNGLWTGKEPPYTKVGVIRNTNFTKEGKLDDSNIADLEVEKKKFEKRKLEYGDVILEKSGGGPKQPVGRVIIFDKKEGNYSFSNFTSLIRVKDFKILDFNFLHKFLYYSYISGVTEKMQSHSTGIRNLDLNAYKKIKIPVPDRSEQHRIVKILDEAFAAITKAKENNEKNLDNSRELFESYLRTVLNDGINSWESKQLGEIGKITSSKRIFKSEYVKQGIPFYRIKEVKELANHRKITTDLYITENKYAEIKKAFGVPKIGDLLMTAVGTIGEIMVVSDNKPFYFKDGNVLWFKDFNSIDPYYLKYILRSLVKSIQKLSVGSAYNALTIEKIEKHFISIPPMPMQKEIVAKLDALSVETKKLEENYKQKLALLEELKKSLLHKAFTGQL